PDRMRLERAVLGSEFKEGEAVWSYRAEEPQPRENIGRLQRRVGPALETVRARLRAKEGREPSSPDLVLYEDAALHLLYNRYYDRILEGGLQGGKGAPWRFYTSFLSDWRHYFEIE